jgi:predicted dehydrogenase
MADQATSSTGRNVASSGQSGGLRIGVLGAARIVPRGLLEPAAANPDLVVTRLAARDPGRARAFALEHGIPSVSASYQDLLAADDVDVIYNPLPISLHASWTIAALRAGKQVLCEKPLASNAGEAAEMVAVAQAEGRALGEAFHHRYHPLFERILAVMASGALGTIERIEGTFNVPISRPDIRWDYTTGGGALIDLGCYPVSWLRHLAGEEPTVVSATAVEDPARVDAAITAELAFPSGITGLVAASMIDTDHRLLRVVGSAGWLEATNPISPQRGHNLVIETSGGRTTAPVDAGNSYGHMLRAFADHIVHGTPFLTSGDDAAANMTAIDAIYTAAGLPLRGLAVVA